MVSATDTAMAEKDMAGGLQHRVSKESVATQHFDEEGIQQGDPNVDIEAGPSRAKEASAGLSKILSRVSRTSVTHDPGPAPDGGLQAWTQVAMGHLIVFAVWGYITSFGVFQAYYVEALGHPPSDISWVGSIQIFLLFGLGTFSGRATDAGFFRLCLTAGAILQLLGVFMTSLCTEYWQLLLAQGLCTGIGNGLLFCPTVSTVATYFEKKRAFALAVVAAGTAAGGMVFPGMIEALLPRIGFGWTLRTLGFVMLVLQAVAAMFMRTRLPPRRTGPLVEWAAFKEMPYALFAVAVFLLFWGVFPAFYYISAFASTILHTSQSTSINLLLVLNGVGIPGRVIPGLIADEVTGPMNLLIPGTLVGGVLIYCWIAVRDVAGLYVFAAIYGTCGAMMQALFIAVLSSLTEDKSKMGTRIGMVFTIVSFGVLTGSPIAGALLQKDGGSYLPAQVFVGTSLVAAALTLCCARVARVGWRVRTKI